MEHYTQIQAVRLHLITAKKDDTVTGHLINLNHRANETNPAENKNTRRK